MLLLHDGSKQQNIIVVCPFTAVTGGLLVAELQIRLTDGAKVFAVEVHAIKEAVTDALQRDLSEIHKFSDSRLALQALNCLVSQHRAISEIKDLVKRSEVEVNMHWTLSPCVSSL